MSFVTKVVDSFKLDTKEWDPTNRFVTSWLLPPWVLFACRALITLYILTSRFFIIAYECIHNDCITARNEVSYFTVLTFWGLGFYYLFSSIHTASYCLTGRPLLARWPRILQALHRFYYTTITIMPIIVTIVYWGIIYEGNWFPTAFKAWDNITQHALNLVFCTFEIAIPRTPAYPVVHLFWIIIVMLLYLSLAYLTEATRHFYTYSFLDSSADGAGSKGKVAGYILGILVAFIVFFFLSKGLIWTRRWVTEKKLGMTGKFVEKDKRSDLEIGMVQVGSKERESSA